MNRRAISALFLLSLAVLIYGVVEGTRASWRGDSSFIAMCGAVFCMAFGRMLVVHFAWESRPIRLGAETLPPSKDVAAVLVGGGPISDKAKKELLQAIQRAKRATKCGSVARELPFQIVDHWGGVWELEAYEEVGGTRGFSANRVYYAGDAAEIVARCVGV